MINKLIFNEKGLIPAVVQDCKTNKVLTLCYMDKEALEKTIKEGKVYVFRRSKNRVMLKGETSGNVQIVKEVLVDCTDNSLLFKVEQKTAACHKGYFTCYYREIDKSGNEKIVEKRIFDPKDVYRK
ncbi:MAG: phosphoribosyl-AMP cyclohydrolase [Candidatus Omnitrophica bacterium]|nr:phosphoribosyl-AMP cyclohydrolase [Candidatus Omnitrophota bacterium]